MKASLAVKQPDDAVDTGCLGRSGEAGQVMHALRAMKQAFIIEWKSSLTVAELLYPLIGQASTVVCIGWIAHGFATAQIVLAIAWGSFMTALWRSAAFRGGWIMSQSHLTGTLEMELVTRARVPILILGKLAAVTALYAMVASLSTVLVLSASSVHLHVAFPAALLVSILIAVLAITSYAYLLIPISFLTGGLPGFFNAILPAIVILSGFLQPTSVLPKGVQILCDGLSTTWAMKAVVLSVQPDLTYSHLASAWAISLGISLLTFAFAKGLIDAAESRLRQGIYTSFSGR